MLDGQITAIIPVKNLDAAHDFYNGVLGLPFIMKAQKNCAIYGTASNGVVLFEWPDQAGASGDSMVAVWIVQDIHKKAAFLTEKGVKFKHVSPDGVMQIMTSEGFKSIDFYDPDGNCLSVSQII